MISKLFGGGKAAGGGGGGSGGQTQHRAPVAGWSAQVAAVQADVYAGSGREISPEQAGHMLYGIQSYSGTGYQKIRYAYQNPGADPRNDAAMRAVDDYLHSAPKWHGGTIYRGINVDRATAEKLMSGEPVDMLGPSSWSSDLGVAEDFADGYKEVKVIFVLPENKSGASITHIGSLGATESEVTAPSGVKYAVDKVERVKRPAGEFIYIHVHE